MEVAHSPRPAEQRRGAGSVEEGLITWKRNKEERLTQMRAETRARELHEVQSAPRINDLSRKIVAKANLERYGAQPKSIQIEVIPMSPPASARVPRPANTTSPAPQPVSLPPKREMTQSEANMVRAIMLHGSPNRGHLGIPALGEEVARKKALQSLRDQVLTRFSVQEPSTLPDYTSLSFSERNFAFHQHQKRHFAQIADSERSRQRQECTFQPIFYARVPHHRQNSSTSELLRISQARSPVSRPSSRSSLSRSQCYYELYQRRLTETIRNFAPSS